MQQIKDKSILPHSSVLEDLSMIGELFSIANVEGPQISKSNFDAIDGILENGAILTIDNKKVINIGGINDGSYTINFNSPETANYNVTIKYSCIDGDKPLRVDINNEFKTVYHLPKTVDDSEDSDAIFTFKAKFYEGENKVKFHGDGINVAPSISSINFNILKSLGTYNLMTVSITEDDKEKINNSIKESPISIGSSQVFNENSLNQNIMEEKIEPIELNLTVPYDGIYDFSIPYMGLDSHNLKIEVNGIESDISSYLNMHSKDGTVVKLFLKGGENLIRVYN
ncbi:hypothetical protein [Clostridium tarantellae]|uniref:Uncharacterized protein n=1 Tax=Clostridium tarantellae TaxID=39493 RepID=A0A6I1MRX4_9CLOT|nr:hypothetical protein [Clostridium tarantellae]MPQ43641.1 hypothetical protein [Clostridium tarantellae]